MTIRDKDSEAAIASRIINQTNRHLFLTGKAGTGKTTFLKYISEYTHKNSIVAAPTGIAAINAGGVTLHSLFQLPFGSFIPSNDRLKEYNITTQINTPQSLIKDLKMNSSKRKMLKELELLIIDEVSMVRADLLDAIDIVLRHIKRQKNKSFGGVQLLLIGDLLQLPPVVKEEEWNYLNPYYPGIYFFNAKALQQNKPLHIELNKIYRQSDKIFISLLNNLRDNSLTKEDIELLNRHYKPSFKPNKDDGYIFLTTHNRKADEINRQSLKELPGKIFNYDAEIDGDFNEYLFPVEFKLELKKGAQVMFIKNDYSGEQRYFNGKIGLISYLSSGRIEVSFNDGTPPAVVEHYTWENKKFSLNKETNEIDENIKGAFSHYPIKLAWAITVHKSQGLTFTKAIIDVSRAFAPGQIYVALSRLVSLDGLVLTGPVPLSGLEQDGALSGFLTGKETPDVLEKVLKEETPNFVADTVFKAFDFKSLCNSVKYHAESYTKDDKRSVKQQHKNWAMKLHADLIPVKEVADKFSGQLSQIIGTQYPGYLSVLYDRVEAAKDYFEPLLKGFSERIFCQINSLKKKKGIKAYMNELRDIELLFFKQLQVMYKSEALINSAINGTELLKENLLNSTLYKERKSFIQEKSVSPLKNGYSKNYKRAQKKNKKEKGPDTKEVSYNLYKEGKTIKEIATERSFAITTIEGHLAHYVAKGLIDVSNFVNENKVKQVIEASQKLETKNLGPIKKYLGNEFTYSDLRFAMASYYRDQDS